MLEAINCSTFTLTSLQKIVDKGRFLFLVNNYPSLSKEETEELAVLQNEYPYSQAIHNLTARGAQTNDLPVKEKYLHLAAVYATDRTVLKNIVTAPKTKRAEPPKPQPTPQPLLKKQVPQKVETPEAEPFEQTISTTILDGDNLLNEVFHDLDMLKKSKHDFELVADGFDIPEAAPAPLVKKIETRAPETEPDQDGERIIKEIKVSKKKIKPIDPKQKEQLEIIDQFIKSKPSINRNKLAVTTPASDLTEKSSVFSENIISETLVEILIKQGKKEKAVEVLKKLIWKFPQKKAYFAAQIEELKS